MTRPEAGLRFMCLNAVEPKNREPEVNDRPRSLCAVAMAPEVTPDPVAQFAKAVDHGQRQSESTDRFRNIHQNDCERAFMPVLELLQMGCGPGFRHAALVRVRNPLGQFRQTSRFGQPLRRGIIQQVCWQENRRLSGFDLPVESVKQFLISSIHKVMILSRLSADSSAPSIISKKEMTGTLLLKFIKNLAGKKFHGTFKPDCQHFGFILLKSTPPRLHKRQMRQDNWLDRIGPQRNLLKAFCSSYQSHQVYRTLKICARIEGNKVSYK